MAFWSVREELSQINRLRRSYYELLRDELDQYMLEYALTNSYLRFASQNIPYPFVEKRELKPRARIPSIEYPYHNTFLVIFVEDTIPAIHKKYIRFLNVNKTTKTNLLRSRDLPLPDNFDRNQRYLESVHFYNFLKVLLPVDFALLIQRNPAIRAKDRYQLTHFHVKIDWPIAEAAEDLGQKLRYISKDLYEKGDAYAEVIQKKFFEYYGLQVMAGGRRSAAIVAAQYLKRIPCISTIYAGSSESRSLTRISERGVSKAVLVKFSDNELQEIAKMHNMQMRTFTKNYLVARKSSSGICIFQAIYTLTNHARPPDDGKLREINPDVNWHTVGDQYLLPRPGVQKYPPLPINWIYL